MKKKFILIGAVALVLALAFAACPTTTVEKPGTDIESPMPVIMVHPTSADYLASDTIAPLTVTEATATSATQRRLTER